MNHFMLWHRQPEATLGIAADRRVLRAAEVPLLRRAQDLLADLQALQGSTQAQLDAARAQARRPAIARAGRTGRPRRKSSSAWRSPSSPGLRTRRASSRSRPSAAWRWRCSRSCWARCLPTTPWPAWPCRPPANCNPHAPGGCTCIRINCPRCAPPCRPPTPTTAPAWPRPSWWPMSTWGGRLPADHRVRHRRCEPGDPGRTPGQGLGAVMPIVTQHSHRDTEAQRGCAGANASVSVGLRALNGCTAT